MTIDGLALRPFAEDDLLDVQRLHQAAFGRALDAAHYRWKHRTLRCPTETVWLLHGPAGELVAHYAGLPVRLRGPAGESWGFVSVDSMTHPAWRGRGLTTKLGRAAYRRWEEEAGARLVLGLPNQAWGRRIGELGLAPIFPWRWWVRPLLPDDLWRGRGAAGALARSIGRAWDRSARRLAPGPRPTFEEIQGPGPALDAVARLRGDARYAVVRDADWLAWRYLAEPTGRYRLLAARRGGALVGRVAMAIEGGVAVPNALLGEVTSPEGARAALIASACEYLRERGVARVATMAAPRSAFARDLVRAGFLPWRWAYDVSAARLGAAAPAQSALSDPDDWDLQPGDFDAV